MNATHGRRSGRPDRRLGIGARLGLVFGAVALLLAAIGVIVSLRVREMHTSIARVLEEHREAMYSRDIAHALRAVETHVRVQTAPGEDESGLSLMRELVSDARATLAALERGPQYRDPSDREHSNVEDGLYGRLDGALERVMTELVAGPEAQRRLAAVQEARKLADALRDEHQREARESSGELLARGGRLRSEVVWVTLAALVVLGAVTFFVKGWIVRPIERLREGAARIGAGDLKQRVEIASRDEIGELAEEFNRMAGELQGMRDDLERRVEQRTHEFVRAARLAGLGTLAAGVAHEVNNPLASIASCAEGLERKLRNGGATVEQQREYLQIIAKEAYRAHEITARLLDFARTERGAPESYAVADVLREIEILLEHRLRARALRLEVACAPDVPGMHGHPAECKQVLLNLLHNAIDASPDGAAIRVSCRREGGTAVLEVEDRGPGIPPEHLDRIFDPFFTTKEPGKGTGLGLSIVHRIVEALGGRTEVENTGHGALFRVRVPLRAAST